MLDMVKKVIVHQLYAAAHNGKLKLGARALSKDFPEYSAFIKTCCSSNSMAMTLQLRTINNVANAFRANRAAAGIKEPFIALV